MPPRPPPQALEPYLSLPPELSSILLTSTLGCSINWLTALLATSASNQEPPHHSLILASWLRTPTFWKNELRRTTSLDASKQKNVTFIDCFSSALSLAETDSKISDAIASLEGKVILVLDNPDVLLATGLTTAHDLNLSILKLRSRVHATIITCSADLPLISAATLAPEARPTPLETETAAFITAQAHAARLVMSVRELDTGAARDVSGVLRITRGGRVYDYPDHKVKEAELLYLVQRDGNVKVFNRGSDGS